MIQLSPILPLLKEESLFDKEGRGDLITMNPFTMGLFEIDPVLILC